MKKWILTNVKSIFNRALNGITNIMYEIPVPGQELATPTGSPEKLQKSKAPLKAPSEKGEVKKAKGNINTDAATFHHPRKDAVIGQGNKR